MATTVASIAMCILVAGMGLLMQGVAAQDSRAFDIPAQPLHSALDTFGRQTGFSGLYGAAATSGRISKQVAGHYTPRAALAAMLAGTGLTAYFTAADAFVLESAPLPAPAAAERDASYDGPLREQVRAAFCAVPAIAAGGFRIALRFHVDSRGRVVRPALLDSTGEGARDRAVLGALQRVEVGYGPADMAQPFFMLILPHALAAPGACAVQ